jgi:hypothetical protein
MTFGVALAGLLIVAGCAAPAGPQVEPPRAGTAVPAPAGGPGAGPAQAQDNCCTHAASAAAMAAAVGSAAAGDRICLAGDMGQNRLVLTRSGTPAQPILVLGGGRTTTAGITIEADKVMIDGVAARNPAAPGVSLRGANVALTNSTVSSPQGGDGDGIRFWGRNITIAHNTISDTSGRDERHADCMQTFATDGDHPASQDVRIEANRANASTTSA